MDRVLKEFGERRHKGVKFKELPYALEIVKRFDTVDSINRKLREKNRKLKALNHALFKCYCGDYDDLTEEEKKLLPEV